MDTLLKTKDGKKVTVNMQKDINLYSSYITNSGQTMGWSLYYHKPYFYEFHWDMWHHNSNRLELVSEKEAKDFVIAQLNRDPAMVDIEECEKIWGKDFFQE
jgi:hypothetical protein